MRRMLNSKVQRTLEKTVEIEFEGQSLPHRNDAVIVWVRGLLPTPLLQKIGIRFDTKFDSE